MKAPNPGCDGTFFKVMYKGTLLNLIHPTIRRLVNEVPSEYRCWVIMSALHVLNLDTKVMRHEISDVFNAKHDLGKVMDVREYKKRRRKIQRIYLEVLHLLMSVNPNTSRLNTTYLRVQQIDEDEFHNFVKSVMRTVAEFEAGGSDVVAYNRHMRIEI